MKKKCRRACYIQIGDRKQNRTEQERTEESTATSNKLMFHNTETFASPSRQRNRSKRWSFEGYRYATNSASCDTNSSNAFRDVTDIRGPPTPEPLKTLWREFEVAYPVITSSCTSDPETRMAGNCWTCCWCWYGCWYGCCWYGCCWCCGSYSSFSGDRDCLFLPKKLDNPNIDRRFVGPAGPAKEFRGVVSVGKHRDPRKSLNSEPDFT